MNTQPKQTASAAIPLGLNTAQYLSGRVELREVYLNGDLGRLVATAESLPDARLLLKPYNSHASLVAALEKAEAKLSGIARLAATRTFSSTNFQLNSITEEAQSGYEAARAALAAAKEGA